MKTSKLLGALLFTLFVTVQVNAQEKVINIAELPVKAHTFLKTHFIKEPVGYILKDSDIFSTDYTVNLVNGTKIEFDNKGNWDEVKGKNNPLPEAFVPASIVKYVKEKFPNNTITEIDKNYWNYEVKISNGLELKFNSKGEFLKIDD